MVRGYVLSLIPEVEVDRLSVDHVIVRVPDINWKCTFRGLSPGLRKAIEVLSSTGATEDELASLVEEIDGSSTLAQLYYYLSTFAKRRILCYGICYNGRQLATLIPNSGSLTFSPSPVNPQLTYTLSRFVYLHRDSEDLILESPLAHAVITLHRWEGAAVIAELSKAHTFGSLCDVLPCMPSDIVGLFLEMLLDTHFVSEVKPADPYMGESEDLVQWDFHDLLFHARSRLGRHAYPYGGTYRFHNKIRPLPVVKQHDAEEYIDLSRPDISSLERQDRPFTLILEQRRSIRKYGQRPITGQQLGEFLYRSARVKELQKMDLQDLSRRPYPAGGAIYELELYANVHRCENIPPALYHYCPEKHRLERICGPTEAVEALLKDAARSAGLAEEPQVLITVAARFQRLSWKYESMAYNVLLKNVGALYQTMYLVATAMELAPCALGGGNSDLFAQAAGLAYYAETSVGEFLVGSRSI